VRSNTGILLARVLAGAEAAGAETEQVNLRELTFRSCRHCGGCERTGKCVTRDDLLSRYETMRRAQHLVLASPVQFAGVSGETKAMIDRAQALWMTKYRLHQPVTEVTGPRRGLFVATCGGADTRLFGWAAHPVKALFMTAEFEYWGELFEANTDAPPPVAERGELLARAERLGESW
jgi:multimeric flavodoxin WrbA